MQAKAPRPDVNLFMAAWGLGSFILKKCAGNGTSRACTMQAVIKLGSEDL